MPRSKTLLRSGKETVVKPPEVWEASCTCGWYSSGQRKAMKEIAKSHVNSHTVRVRKANVTPFYTKFRGDE